MSDKEKVIKELERLSEWFFHQYQVVYDGDAPNYYDAYKTVDDAIALLKEQEPKLVRYTASTVRCPNCNKQITTKGCIHREINYCWKCGQAVKWNG